MDGERARRGGLERLEHPVAHHQAVVSDRDGCLVGPLEAAAVAPHDELANGGRRGEGHPVSVSGWVILEVGLSTSLKPECLDSVGRLGYGFRSRLRPD